MNNKYTKLFSLIAFSISLQLHGCSYTGTIKDSVPMISSISSTPSSQSITLIDNRDEMESLKFKQGVRSLTYDARDSMLNVAKNALKASFAKVDISKTPLPYNQFYAISSFNFRAGNGADITSGLNSKANISIYETATKRRVKSIESEEQTVYVSPGNHVLGYVTVLTFFLASPITMPIIANEVGVAVGGLIEKNEKNLTLSLAKDIAKKDNLAEAKVNVNNCLDSLAHDPDLQVLVGKISLYGVKNQSFDMLSNTRKPSAEEKEALRIYAAKNDRCTAEQEYILDSTRAPQEIKALFDSLKENKKDLTIALYNGELTYGEFARKRRENTAEFDKGLAKFYADLDQRAREEKDKQQQMAIEQERLSIARAQANAAESMAFQNIISNIQQANSNLIQQQALTRLNSQPVYRGPVHTTCTPLYGSVNCTTY